MIVIRKMRRAGDGARGAVTPLGAAHAAVLDGPGPVCRQLPPGGLTID